LVHIPFDTLIKKLVEKSGESQAEIDKRIAEKLNEFSGLISKEGAAHIVANELNIPIGDVAAGPFKIKELRLGMKNITVTGKVLAKYNVTSFAKNGREGRVASLNFGDTTGTCRVTFWHDDVLLHERIQENDIVSLTNLSTKDNRNVLELSASAQTKIVREAIGNPKDLEALAQIAGKKTMSLSDNATTYEPNNSANSNFTSAPPRVVAIRKPINEITANDPLVEIVGIVVQVFKPASFTVDKMTGKKVRLEAGMPADVLHHEQRFVMNIVIDDGTETVRAVFFGDECQRLIGTQSAQMLKENEYEFSKTKTQLLGQTISLTGKVVKNQLYDRIELITRSFSFNPDPVKELALVLSQPIKNTTPKNVIANATANDGDA